MPSGESTREPMVDVSTAEETSATQGWKRFPGLPSASGARQAPDGTPGRATDAASALLEPGDRDPNHEALKLAAPAGRHLRFAH